MSSSNPRSASPASRTDWRLICLVIAGLILAVVSPGAMAQDKKPEAATPAPNANSVNNWWMKRHENKVAQAKARGDEIRLVFLGDSITQAWHGAGKEVWQSRYQDRGAINLGFSADRTERVLWRLQNGEFEGLTPELVVLMIGTNNTHHRKHTPDEVTAGVEAILAEIASQSPATKVLLLGIFPRGEKPDNKLRSVNDATNEKLATLHDGERVFYRNINEAFLHDDGSLRSDLFRDGVHPNRHGYEVWAKAIKDDVDRFVSQ